MNDRDIVEQLREIQRMNTTLHGAQMAARAADEIERLRAELVSTTNNLTEERDEARRECCRWMAEAEGGTPEEHAQEMGWDCYVPKVTLSDAKDETTTQETP